jgi:uncharacterized protein YjbI with pentapeptide repeats
MTNLLLVKEDLKDLDIFKNGINSNTHLLKDPSLNDFLLAVDNNTTHIGFVYHYQGYPSIEFFNDVVIEDNYDESGNLLPTISDNRFINKTFLNMLIEVKKINPNVIFDLLTCNVTDSKFINEISKLTVEYGFTFRYSTNEKGYGGDWIQESHNVSIKDVYFNENIDLWEHVLTASRTISYVATNYPTFFELSGSTLLLKQNFEWTSINLNTDFITLATGEIFDGQGYNIDISSTLTANLKGLFASSATSITNRPIIKNLTVNNFKTLNSYDGIIVRQGQSFFEINDCNSTGSINSSYSGGITGGYSGSNSGNCLIKNCNSSGFITSYAGGIVGYASGREGYCEIINCFISGSMSSYAGGIGAGNLGDNSGNCIINNCYSLGSISSYSGGIAGPNSGNNNGNCEITNCYSKGEIGYGGGGICGNYAGSTGNCVITDCYSEGAITGYGGGICGQYTGNNGNCIITNCYSKGSISSYGGGICAGYTRNCTITNCFSEGVISGYNGGIVGPYTSGNCIISNCASFGSINSTAGGIVGSQASGNIIVSNCYSLGILNDGGGIVGSSSIQSNSTLTVNNCFFLNNIPSNLGGICGRYIGGSTGFITINNCYSTGTLGSNSGSIIGRNSAVTTSTINNCIGREPLVGGNVSQNINNSYTDISNLYNNTFIFSTLGWSNTIWRGIPNSYPRLLSNLDLFNVDLSNNDLSNFNIVIKKINNVNLTNSILTNVNFSKKSLLNVNFTNANLTNNYFINSDLSNVIFKEANFNNVDISNSILIGIDFSDSKLNNSNFINCNLLNSNFINSEISGTIFNNSNLTNLLLTNSTLINTTFPNSITGPLTDSSGIIISSPIYYFIFEDFIIGNDVDLQIRNNTITRLVNIRNDEIIDLSNVVLNTNLLGNTDTEKYTELIKIYNQLRVPFNKINLKNSNKNGYWLNLNNQSINYPIINNNEYLYLLNVPETDVSLSINNQFVANVRKSGSNYIINNTSYNENQKVYIGSYRFTMGTFYIEQVDIVNQIDSIINNQTITIKYIDNLNINGSIVDAPITTVDASVNYLLYSGFRGSLIKFSLNSNITNFSEDPLFLEFDLPNITDTTKTLKLYKIINNELVIDSNYPVNVTYSDNKWRATISTLSDFVVVDENVPETIVGGDPFIKSLKTNKVLLLPNSWKKVILYQSDKYKVIGYNEKLKSEQMLKMKTIKENKIMDITKMETSIYNFNYLVKIEIINLENNDVSVLDTINGNHNNNINIEEIITKNGLNSVDQNFYYPKKNFKSFMIHLDKGNYITVKVDNYWIDLNNIKLYSNNITNISGELVEHNNGNNIINNN